MPILGVEIVQQDLLKGWEGANEDDPQQRGTRQIDMAVGTDALDHTWQQVMRQSSAMQRRRYQLTLGVFGGTALDVCLAVVTPQAGGHTPGRHLMDAVGPWVGHGVIGEPARDVLTDLL